MKRRELLLLATMGAMLPLRRARAMEPEEPYPVVDLHVDLSYQLTYKQQSIARASGNLLADELVRAGYAGIVLPLFVPHDVSFRGPQLADLETSYARLARELGATPPYALPGTVPGTRPVRTWLAFEGAAPLAGAAPEVLDVWVARGLRSFGLVHVDDNALATSSGPTPKVRSVTQGLTAAGREVVERVHAAGAFVDVSHSSDPTVADVLALARTAHVPVVATHSNARALARHSRNLTDEQLRAIADTGGVIGINFHTPYLAVDHAATLDDVVRHIQHVGRVAGMEAVALGSDFEGGIAEPPGLEDVRGLPRLAAALLRAGLGRDDVERVFSRNALRVLDG